MLSDKAQTRLERISDNNSGTSAFITVVAFPSFEAQSPILGKTTSQEVVFSLKMLDRCNDPFAR